MLIKVEINKFNMLSQDEIDETISDLDNHENAQETIEIVAGINETYYCNNKLEIVWDYLNNYLKKELHLYSVIRIYHPLFDEYLEYGIYNSEDIQKCNEALKQIGINAKIVEPREITTVKSVDDVEFEVYIDELNKIVDKTE